MAPGYVVVDGSNIATEGRSIPSLAHLDEAVTQFQAEFPGNEVIVVVDATFGHRIDPSERAAFDEAVANAEMVSPPAGAVGRGDAFLLRVAERVGAQVLSNDSFQEFHLEHPWLFEEGRLIGGKPVPGVGWIFTPRNPVRGALSRAVVSGRPTRRGRLVRGDGGDAADAEPSATAGRAAKASKSAKATTTAKATKTANADGADKTGKPAKAARTAKTEKAEKAEKAAKTDAGAKKAKTAKADGAAKPAKATKAGKADKAARADRAGRAVTTEKTPKVAKTTKAAKAAKAGATADAGGARLGESTPEPSASGSSRSSRRRRRGRGATVDAVREAIDMATAEVVVPPGADEPKKASAAKESRRRGGAPPAVNDPLTFLTFVSEHPIGSVFEGTVSSFVSHGAMVDVDGMQCYAPLAGLRIPAPRRAREVVERGQRVRFTLVALDTARRGAELALPDVAAARVDA